MLLKKVNILNKSFEYKITIDRLKSLNDGWLDGDGKAPSLASIDTIESLLSIFTFNNIELPVTYPTPEGGISAEWKNNPFILTIEADGLIYLLDTSTDNDHELITLTVEDDVTKLISTIRGIKENTIQQDSYNEGYEACKRDLIVWFKSNIDGYRRMSKTDKSDNDRLIYKECAYRLDECVRCIEQNEHKGKYKP